MYLYMGSSTTSNHKPSRCLPNTVRALLIVISANINGLISNKNSTKHVTTVTFIYLLGQHIHALQTVDKDIQHCIHYITNIAYSVLTGDENAHSTRWHSYTDDRREQLIADVISNSDHITQQPECQTSYYTNHNHQISPLCVTHCTTGHYHHIIYPSSPQLTYDMATDYNKTDGLSPSTRKPTVHNSRKTHR